VSLIARRRLAGALRGVVAEAERPRVALSPVPVRRGEVLAWRHGLLGLAERLERATAVSACGVARARVLVTDGTGPLYSPSAQQRLGEAIWGIADGFALCAPHRWGCPVIMKLDPERVAWTCAGCGAIATTADLSVKPS
jgi:hypothetical protein